MPRARLLRLPLLWLIVSLVLAACVHQARAQNSGAAQTLNTGAAKRNREMGLAMLQEVKEVLEEYYYDPNYRGIDLKARIKADENRIKTLNHNWEVYRVLAQLLLDLNDSHTGLILPPRTDHFEYGFTTQMIGNQCFVVSVKKDSDAEKQGLRVGDEVRAIGQFVPTRKYLWKIMYLLYKLDPSNTVDLKIKNLAGQERQMTIAARTMTEKEFNAERKKHKDDEEEKPFKCQEISSEIVACKLYTFSVEKNQIDKMMKQVGQHSKLILDLRGNSGGYVSIEKYLTGYFFDHNLKIADAVSRKKTESWIAKSKQDKSFKGDLIVLVDSESASASELFARVVQLEKRGKIIGDVTSAAVMTSITVGLFGQIRALDEWPRTYTGMNVTIADVIMKDGGRIEGVGVIPDLAIAPTGLALAKKTDPVLSYVATILGAKLTPEEAGKLYFMNAKPEDAEEPQKETEP